MGHLTHHQVVAVKEYRRAGRSGDVRRGVDVIVCP